MPLILQRLLLPHLATGTAPRPVSTATRHLHPAWVVVLISTWLATACNVPLWREVAQLPGQGSLRGWGFAIAFALIVAAGNAAPLSLLAWRWPLKPAATVLALAVPPLWWLLRRPVLRLSTLRHVAHNGLLLAGAIALIVVCLLLV